MKIKWKILYTVLCKLKFKCLKKSGAIKNLKHITRNSFDLFNIYVNMLHIFITLHIYVWSQYICYSLLFRTSNHSWPFTAFPVAWRSWHSWKADPHKDMWREGQTGRHHSVLPHSVQLSMKELCPLTLILPKLYIP